MAKQGQFRQAGIELKNAEHLQPGLPFVMPDALQILKSRISFASNDLMQPNTGRQNRLTTVKDWLLSVFLILGTGFLGLLMGFMSQRISRMIPDNSYPGNAPGSNMPTVNEKGACSIIGQSLAGEMSSGLIGGLATGAIMGAGEMADETLMHRFIVGNKNNVMSEQPFQDSSTWNTSGNMKGTDNRGGAGFAIANASSWDDDRTNN